MVCLELTLLTLLIAAPDLYAAEGNVFTCDGDVQRLTCSTGLIRVASTVYGRIDSNICLPPNPSLTATNTNCFSTVTSIAERCNGLKECEVKTDLLNSPDPCTGTYKYYITHYECINGQNIAVCENGYHTLDCGAKTIDIINANFGHADTTTCSNGLPNGLNDKTNCFAPNVFSAVKSLCNGQGSCTVQASFAHTFKGSCKPIAKYLTVSYRCLTHAITCESSTVNLDCGTSKVEIISADYGRSDTVTCSASRPPAQLTNTNCRSPTAVDKVRNSCDRQTSCSVPATNAFFGEPCAGTFKYLRIVFTCI